MKPGFQGLAFPKQTEKDRFIITLLSTLLSVCEAIVLFHRSTLFSKGLFLHSNSLIPPTLSPSAASFVFFLFLMVCFLVILVVGVVVVANDTCYDDCC